MLGGKITGDYKYHHEAKAGLNSAAVGENHNRVWTTRINLSEGLWIVQAFVQFSIRNLTVSTYVITDRQIHNGNPIVDATASPNLGLTSLASIIDDVRVASAASQEFRVTMRGGIGGGEFRDQSVLIVAYKKQES